MNNLKSITRAYDITGAISGNFPVPGDIISLLQQILEDVNIGGIEIHLNSEAATIIVHAEHHQEIRDLYHYKGFRAIIHYDEDDKIFVGETIGIEDIVSFHGKTIEEAEENFNRALDLWLENRSKK